MGYREKQTVTTEETYFCDICKKDVDDYDDLRQCHLCENNSCWRCLLNLEPIIPYSSYACTDCKQKANYFVEEGKEAKRNYEKRLSDLAREIMKLKKSKD